MWAEYLYNKLIAIINADRRKNILKLRNGETIY